MRIVDVDYKVAEIRKIKVIVDSDVAVHRLFKYLSSEVMSNISKMIYKTSNLICCSSFLMTALPLKHRHVPKEAASSFSNAPEKLNAASKDYIP